MNTLIFCCPVCNKQYKYKKAFIDHYKKHAQTQIQAPHQEQVLLPYQIPVQRQRQPQHQLPHHHHTQLHAFSPYQIPVHRQRQPQHQLPHHHHTQLHAFSPYQIPVHRQIQQNAFAVYQALAQQETPLDYHHATPQMTIPQFPFNSLIQYSTPHFNIPLQYTVPMEYGQYPALTYYPSLHQPLLQMESVNQVEQQEDNIESDDMNISVNNTTYNMESMDISNTSNEDPINVQSVEHNSSLNREEDGKSGSGSQKFYEINSAFKNNIAIYGILNKRDELLFEDFVNENRNILRERIESSLQKYNIIKFNITLIGEYVKIVSEEMELNNISHRAKMTLVCLGDNIDELLTYQLQEIHNKMSEFQERDSGWTLTRIIRVELNINKSSLVRGSSWISTPEKLKNKGACINIENDDNYCFKWAVIAGLNNVPIINRHRSSSYDVDDISVNIICLRNGVTLDFSGLTFPLPLKSVKTFEEKNRNISVNVFGYDDEHNEVVGPYYITKKEKPTHINLMLLQNEDGHHYILINNISRLLKKQITNHCEKLLFCNSCLQYTHNDGISDRHKSECGKIVSQLPSAENAILKFKDYQRQLDVPFVVYADFECILEEVSVNLSTKTKFIKKHIPCAFSYLIKSKHDSSLDKFRIYTGEDASEKFVYFLQQDSEEIFNSYLSVVRDMIPLSSQEQFLYNNAIICHICKKMLNNDSVRDHCHISGKFRGAAHQSCNLNYQVAKFIPIYFHNYSSYDSHLFMKELSKISNKIKVIPLNKELYISLSIYIGSSDECLFELRFLDTMRFMSESLESLTSNLTDDDFCTIKEQFTIKKEFDLIRKKGVFPYEYMNSFEKLNETQLPSRDHFFSHLNDKECSVDDYEHAKEVWNTFNCTTIQQYMELYLKTDVLLLTDVFENFRNVCKKNYNLDPCQYYTAPGLSWDAMLKHTNIELELLTDIDMYNFFKKGIRGGIVQCSKRYGKANNKYLKDYDKDKPSEYLIYLDANNLYGWAMSEYLPYRGFKWLPSEELNLDPRSIENDSINGYVYEVDLEYPFNLHDIHNDLPFCAENKQIGASKYKKLITDFSPKNSYIIHYRVLKQCLEHGVVLKKIHRILAFKQSPWLKDYIDLNTMYRAAATNTFEKNFFKLLNNAVYGKTMENVDNRRDVKIVTNWNRTNRNHLGAQDWISKSNFHSLSIFTDDMVAIEMKRVKTYYNKPIYLGFCVLDLSKWKMYNFHYNYMLPKFKSGLSLHYMDTDSFIYNIKTDDFYADIKEDLNEEFDTSDYPPNNAYSFPLLNKKVLGKMKDENCGKIMNEFVGLRSKMYSLSIENGDEIKKSKGVKKCVLEKYSLASYKNCLFNKTNVIDDMLTFKSKIHQIYTSKLKKVILSYDDDKRNILDDNINTYAWNHFRIKESNPSYELDMLLMEIEKLKKEEE